MNIPEEAQLMYISTAYGCAIRRGTRERVMRQMAREIGTDNVREIRPANDDDIAWVRGMGGHVPEAS